MKPPAAVVLDGFALALRWMLVESVTVDVGTMKAAVWEVVMGSSELLLGVDDNN